jgi:hypothetical protein
MVITEMSMFPAGRHDDLTASATQALKYLRDRGWEQTDEEQREAEIGSVMHSGCPGRRRRAVTCPSSPTFPQRCGNVCDKVGARSPLL